MSNHLDGKICTAAERELERVGTSGADHILSCLTHRQSIGMIFAADAGIISIFAVLTVFGLIIRNMRRFPGERLIKQPMDVYILFLFTSDLVLATGQVMYVKWAIDGKVHIGSYCTAQGAICQLGATTVAIGTMTIAIHTFLVIWKGKESYKHPIRRASYIVGLAVLFITLFLAISINVHKSPPYYAPSFSWCWISKNYPAYWIVGSYLWMWLALLCSIVLYTYLFVMLRPTSKVRKGWWGWHVQWMDVDDLRTRRRRRTALCMVMYPLTYSILTVPIMIARWTSLKQAFTGNKQNHVSPAFAISGITIFGLSGAVNVLLLLLTRPNVLLFGRESPSTTSESHPMYPPPLVQRSRAT